MTTPKHAWDGPRPKDGPLFSAAAADVMNELSMTVEEFNNVLLRPVLKTLYINSRAFTQVPSTTGPLRLAIRVESAGQPRLRVYYRLDGDGDEWYWLEWVEIHPDWAAEHLPL